MNDSQTSPEVAHLLDGAGRGDPSATEALLPLVYAELRSLARARLAREKHGNESAPTSLVHDAYVRLVGDREMQWANRAHFFVAAGEAMRRILIERARRRAAVKHGGQVRRVSLVDDLAGTSPRDETLLALDEALSRLEDRDPTMSEVVKLRYFAGMTIPETATALEISERTVTRHWSAARAWLHREIET